MDADVGTLVGLLAEHGGALAWAVIKALLRWGTVSLIATLTLYFICTGYGLLDIRGQRKRAARVVYGLVLFLGVGPLATAAGIVHELRKATVHSVYKEVGRTETLRTVGGVLVAPAVLAHLVAEERYDSAQAAALSWQDLESNDLSFLTRAPTRERAFGVITETLIRSGTKKVPGYDKVEENRTLRWLVHRAEGKMADKASQRATVYTSLFKHVKADDDGKLSFASAADQVGKAFWRQAAEPALMAPFNALRLQLLIAALLLWLLAIGAIQLAGRKLVKPKTEPG